MAFFIFIPKYSHGPLSWFPLNELKTTGLQIELQRHAFENYHPFTFVLKIHLRRTILTCRKIKELLSAIPMQEKQYAYCIKPSNI